MPPLSPEQKKHLANVRELLRSKDWGVVKQGLELLRGLADPALYAALAEGLAVDAAGRIVASRRRPHGLISDKDQLNAELALLRGAGRLEGVKELDLSGSPFLTDLSALSGLRSLRSLDLAYCSILEDLSPLAGLPALATLNLTYCESLRDLRPLADLPSLRTLDISSCELITDLRPLHGLRALRRLLVQGCELSRSQIEALKRRLPECVVATEDDDLEE